MGKERLKKWLQRKLLSFLGLYQLRGRVKELERLNKDLVNIGVDVHFKEPHMILIYTKLGGGQIRHVEASFKSLRELNEFVRELRERYHTNAVTYDLPRGMRRYGRL